MPYHDPETLTLVASLAYRAYNASTGGLNWQGSACPQWADLPQTQRVAWMAAVEMAILSAHQREAGLPMPNPGWGSAPSADE